MYDTILLPKTQADIPCMHKTRNSPKTPCFRPVRDAGMHKKAVHCACVGHVI